MSRLLRPIILLPQPPNLHSESMNLPNNTWTQRTVISPLTAPIHFITNICPVSRPISLLPACPSPGFLLLLEGPVLLPALSLPTQTPFSPLPPISLHQLFVHLFVHCTLWNLGSTRVGSGETDLPFVLTYLPLLQDRVCFERWKGT